MRNQNIPSKIISNPKTIEKTMSPEKNIFKRDSFYPREIVVEAVSAIIGEKWEDAEQLIGRLSNATLKQKLITLYRNKIIQERTIRESVDSLNRILNYASSQEIAYFPLQMSDKLGQVDISSLEKIIKLANARKVASLLLQNGKNVNLNSYKGSLTDESMSNLASMEKILSEYSIKKSSRLFTQESDKAIRCISKLQLHLPIKEMNEQIKRRQLASKTPLNEDSFQSLRKPLGLRYEEDVTPKKNNLSNAFLKNNMMKFDIKKNSLDKEQQKSDRPTRQREKQQQVLNQNKQLSWLGQMKLQMPIISKEAEQKSTTERFKERELQFAKKEAQYKEQIAKDNEKLKELEKFLQETRSLEQQLKQTSAQMKKSAQISSKMIADLNSKCSHLEALLKQQQQTQHERMNKAEHDNIIRDYQNRIMGLEENVRMFKNENSALAANQRFLDTEIEEKTEKLTQLQAAQKNHEQAIITANNLLEEHKSAREKERKDYFTERAKLIEKFNEFLLKIKQLESQCATKNVAHAQLQAKNAQLKKQIHLQKHRALSISLEKQKLTRSIEKYENQSQEQHHHITMLNDALSEATNFNQSLGKEMNLKDKRFLQLSNLNAELRKQSKRSRIAIEKLEENIKTKQMENLLVGQL